VKERDIFIAALQRDDPEDRRAYLGLACEADPGLRQRVEALFGAFDQAGSFLRPPATDQDLTSDFVATGVEGRGTTAPTPPEERPGTTIGPYKLMEQIGEGGMGVVYVAEQHEPVRRRVALKVIKPGMDSRQVVARFEAERQALALMDHPNIARVIDAGSTPEGRPYFVMELVRGIPITEYCDREQLTIPERLELFVLVCRAVQHAHQKGIIHRDLKPTNILVTVVDGAAVPKVIDFGVAKATGAALCDRTVYTGFHQFVGTPLYMSPEQADLTGVDVDTRSDIYSLGVLLYELLTGTTPFNRETLKQAAFDEMRRIIREEQPPRPSTRLGTLGEALTTASARRKADPRRLGPSMRGELDWVVMKALEKDRARRYETANDFAADVMRFLTDRPVEACPPSQQYRLGKFARRNRAGLTTAALVAVSLVAGTAVSLWQATRAKAAEAVALLRAEEARQVVDYLVQDVFAAAVPGKGRGRSVTVGELLDQADATVAARFRGQPLVEASVRLALAEANQSLIEWGHQGRAVQNATRAVELRTRHLGPEHLETLAALAQLASILLDQGWSDRSKLEASADIARRVLSARRRVLGPAHPETIGSHTLLATLLLGLGRPDEALAQGSQAEVLALRALGPDHKTTLEVWNALGQIVANRGDQKRGEALLRRAVAGRERILGPLDPETIRALHNLAGLVGKQGRLDEARQLYLEVVGRTSKVYGPCSIQSSSAIGGLFAVLEQQRDSAAIRDFCQSWLRDILATPPDADAFLRYRRSVRLGNMAFSLVTLPDPIPFDADLAVRAVDEAVALDPNTCGTLAQVYARLGRLNLARQRLAEVAELALRSSDNPRTLRLVAWRLMTCPVPELRDPTRALKLARKAVEKAPQASYPQEFWRTLGVAYYRAGDWAAAIAALEKSETLDPDEDRAINGLFLAMAHWQLGEKDKARTWYDQAVPWRNKHKPQGAELRCFREEAEELLGIDANQEQ